MQPNPKFLAKNRKFWAQVKLLSQLIGYTDRKTKTIRKYSFVEIKTAFQQDGLKTEWMGTYQTPSQDAIDLIEYSNYRSDVLTNEVKNNLMDKDQAKELFHEIFNKLNPTCPIPMNKQSGAMKDYNFLTGIVNMLVDHIY